MLADVFPFHIKEFGTAGHKHRQHILLFVPGIFPIVFNQADLRHIVKNFCKVSFVLARGFNHLGHSHALVHFHFKRNLCHFIRYHGGKSPIFGVINRHLFAHLGHPRHFIKHAVRNLCAQLYDKLPRRLVAVIFIIMHNALRARIRFALGLHFVKFIFIHKTHSPSLYALFLPLVNFVKQPVCPFVYALARFCADKKNLCIGVSFLNIFFAFFNIKIKIRQHIDFIYKHNIAN